MNTLKGAGLVAAVVLGVCCTSATLSRATAVTTSTVEATETRAAEETEVAGLRATVSALETEIATLLAPTSTPTAEPTQTPVPPLAAGSTAPIGDDWEVAVGPLTTMATWNDEVADGVFARVDLAITNTGQRQVRFPFDTLLLRDASGRVFEPDKGIGFDLDAGWLTRFEPGIPADAFITFDVATDAQGPFVLESSEDPTFRVLVQEEVRG
jgi:hypothetical protein